MSDRPYRVYRGGGPVEPREDEPALNLPGATPVGVEAPVEDGQAPPRRGPVILPPPGGAPPEPPRPAPAERGPFPAPEAPRRRRRIRVRTVIAIGVPLMLLLVLGWVVIGYLAFRSSVEAANERLDRIEPPVRPALSEQSGLLLSTSTNILVIGADQTGRSDTLQIIHTDPGKQLMSTLSIPRDMRVTIPGVGEGKLNAAYAAGGPALAIQTVEELTGLPIHHVILVDFRGIVDLVDALGGITIVAPKALRSTFEGRTVNFPKGRQTLDGQRALAYSRVRKNALDASDSDVTRGQRGQQVIAAIRDELSSPTSLFRLRKVGDTIADPIKGTDLSAHEILALGWVSWRSQRTLQCNLGGDPLSIGGQDFLAGDGGANRRVIGEFLGRTAVQAPPKGDPFAAACRAT